MKCPRCNSRELWIYVRFSGYVLCECDAVDEVEVRQSASMTSDWDEESPCRCHACHWTGSVAEVKESAADPASSGGGVRTRQTVTDMAEVKRRLRTQPCPVVWSDCIRYLMAQVEASEKLAKEHAELLKTHKALIKNLGPEFDDTTIM